MNERVNIEVAKYAKSAGVKVIYDMTVSMKNVSDEILKYVDILAPYSEDLYVFGGTDQAMSDTIDDLLTKNRNLDILLYKGKEGI